MTVAGEWTAGRSGRRRFVLPPAVAFATASVSAVMVSVAAGAPAALNTLFEARYGVTPSGLTGAFATYVVCSAAGLLTCGRLSDHLGRRVVGVLALALAGASCVVFLFVDGEEMLIAGRALQGLAVGIGMSALGALVVDLAPGRIRWLVPLITSVAAPFGVATGAVVSGALAQYAPHPLSLVFVLVAVAVALCTVGVLLSPETVARRPGALRVMIPAVAVPARLRRMFAGGCMCFVACWSLGGVYQSLGPSIAADVLGLSGRLAGGIVAGSVIGMTAVGGVATSALPVRRALWIGVTAFVTGVTAIAVCVSAGLAAGFVAASMLAGIGFGASFNACMRALLRPANASETAGLLAAVYLVGFLGSAIPGLVAGFLVADWGLRRVAEACCVVVGLLALAAGVLVDGRLRADVPDEYATPGEFSQLDDVAREVGRDPREVLPVRRVTQTLADGGEISALVWGDSTPQIVFLHGGGQNAHTWDLVAVRLGRPALAIDLPGHGHSSWREDRDYRPVRNAAALAEVVDRLAPDALAVVGMSLGGLTAIGLGAARPDLVRRLVLVDITPRSTGASAHLTPSQRGTAALLSGPREFADLDALIDRVTAVSPRRPRAAVRRGVLHNVVRLPSGGWRWRHDFTAPGIDPGAPDPSRLWEAVDGLRMPVTLARGGAGSHVTGADVAQLRQRLPGVRVEVVPDAGHSVQSDAPVTLSKLIDEVIAGPA
jgi:pimeloyl-ACP methyl ester carboxylesterase/MFS family permease